MELLDILKDEVGLALGCTGPISVAFAVAAASNAVTGDIQDILVIMDKDTYKNSISVKTPGTPFYGVLKPAVVGAFYGDASLGLEVLKHLDKMDEALVDNFAKNHTKVEIKWSHKGMGVFIETFVKTSDGVGHAVVANEHDKIVLLEVNGKVIQKDQTYSEENVDFEATYPIRQYKIKDMVDFAINVPFSDIAFLGQAVDVNYKLAMAGFREKMGSGFGNGFQNISNDSTLIMAKSLAAAASDARMAGKDLPAVSCAKSGNVGIAASLPLYAVANDLGKNKEDLIRAICLSYLITIYVKNHIGRLSAICACSIAASLGTGAGTALLRTGRLDVIENTINNIVGSIGGILCDGAKFGCALKLSMAAGVAIEAAQLAENGNVIPPYNGLVGKDADDTIAILGRIASKGMFETDAYMAKEFINREIQLQNKGC